MHLVEPMESQGGVICSVAHSPSLQPISWPTRPIRKAQSTRLNCSRFLCGSSLPQITAAIGSFRGCAVALAESTKISQHLVASVAENWYLTMTEGIARLHSTAESQMERQFISSAQLILSLVGHPDSVVKLAQALGGSTPPREFDSIMTESDKTLMTSMKIKTTT